MPFTSFNSPALCWGSQAASQPASLPAYLFYFSSFWQCIKLFLTCPAACFYPAAWAAVAVAVAVFVGSPFYAKCKRSARNWHKYGTAEVGGSRSVGQPDLKRYGLPATMPHATIPHTHTQTIRKYIFAYTRTYLNKTLSQDNGALCAITDKGQFQPTHLLASLPQLQGWWWLSEAASIDFTQLWWRKTCKSRCNADKKVKLNIKNNKKKVKNKRLALTHKQTNTNGANTNTNEWGKSIKKDCSRWGRSTKLSSRGRCISWNELHQMLLAFTGNGSAMHFYLHLRTRGEAGRNKGRVSKPLRNCSAIEMANSKWKTQGNEGHRG